MKFLWISALILLMAACTNKKAEDTETSETEKPVATDTLDLLFEIKSEAELIEIFGTENVAFDTVYGPEGEVSQATLLYPKTANQVEITWKNMKKKTGMQKVMLSAWYDRKNERLLLDSRWKTKMGITIGTPLSEVVKINEKPITFLGFGWDFGGIVSDYHQGKLEKKYATLQLGISDFLNQGNDPDFLELMGDNEFSSDNKSAKRLNPVVTSITLSKKSK